MRILFLQKRILFPTDAGCKVRTLNVVRHLARWHDVTYLCNVQPGEEDDLPQMRDLGVRLETVPWRETPRSSPRFFGQLAINLLSRYPFNVNKDYDPALRRRAVELLAQGPYDLVVCDFVQMARNAVGLNAPASLLFQHNVEAEIFRRHAETDDGWLRRKYMAVQWRKMRFFEAAAGRRFDAVIAVSPRDREIFRREYGWNHVAVIDTAVDAEYFRPVETAEVADNVVFVGSLDWLPNEDGLIYFVREVWPSIRQRRPGASFQIIGRNPGRKVQALSDVAGVEVVGAVPDVRPYRSAAAVEVVPLRIGGGTRLKIFEAMAMGKAIVSTALGAEGLDVRDGEHIAIADEPQDLADAVLDLLKNPARRNAIGQRALQLVRENYTSEVVARQFDEICRRTVDARASSTAHSTSRNASTLAGAR
ncbi:MAG: glycosyltransferase [Planctomycetaceae bacterium]